MEVFVNNPHIIYNALNFYLVDGFFLIGNKSKFDRRVFFNCALPNSLTADKDVYW